jgi:hypothetical protein
MERDEKYGEKSQTNNNDETSTHRLTMGPEHLLDFQMVFRPEEPVFVAP